MVQGPSAVWCVCSSMPGDVLQGGLLQARRTLLCASIAAGEELVEPLWSEIKELNVDR